MIRINLLRGERKKDRRAVVRAAEPSELSKQLGFLAIFLVALAIGGWLWLDIQGRKSELNNQIRIATAENERLKSIKEIVDRLEMERERLAARLDVLSNLKNHLRTPLYSIFFIYLEQQNRPGVLIDEIVEKPDRGEGDVTFFTIKGESTNEDLNRFMESLAAEKLVAGVDIVSASGGKFEISVGFFSLSNLEAGDEGTTTAEATPGG